MRNIILICMLTLITTTASAQDQNLFIKELHITQINENQIKANLKVYSPDLATYNTYTTETNGNIITLKVCYNMYFIPSISNIENDFEINIPPDPGGYIFIVKIYRANPGTCSFIEDGYLEDSATLEFTNPFTGTISLSTAEGNIAKSKIEIYPNPTNGLLYFTGLQTIESVSLFDVSGKKVFSQKLPGKQINLSQLNSGNYFLEAVTKEGKTRRKIVVKP